MRHRLRSFLVVLTVFLCTAGSVQPPLRRAGRAFQPGLYLGSWNTGTRGSQTNWVLVAINEKTQGVAYDPPRGRALCQLRLEGDSVAFITGDLTENGEEYQLAFRGTLTDSGLAGTLLVRACSAASAITVAAAVRASN